MKTAMPELIFLDSFYREWASNMWEPMEDRTLEALLEIRQSDLAERQEHQAQCRECDHDESDIEALEECCEAIETAIDRRDAAEMIGGTICGGGWIFSMWGKGAERGCRMGSGRAAYFAPPKFRLNRWRASAQYCWYSSMPR